MLSVIDQLGAFTPGSPWSLLPGPGFSAGAHSCLLVFTSCGPLPYYSREREQRGTAQTERRLFAVSQSVLL